MTSHQGGEPAFVPALLTLCSDLPDTSLRPSPADKSLNQRLFADAIPLPLIRIYPNTRYSPTADTRARFSAAIEDPLAGLLPAGCRRTATPTSARRLPGVPQAEVAENVGLILRKYAF